MEAAAGRVLREHAGIAAAHLEQLYTFGAPDRDPRTRIVTVAYRALMPERAFGAALEGMPGLSAATYRRILARRGGRPPISSTERQVRR